MSKKGGKGLKIQLNLDTDAALGRSSFLVEEFPTDATCLILGRIIGKPVPERYGFNLPVRDKDRLVSLGTIDGELDTLAYQAFVSGKSFEIDTADLGALTTHKRLEFSNLNIDVFARRLLLPGLNHALNIYPLSIAPTVNGVPVTIIEDWPASTVNSAEIGETIEYNFDSLLTSAIESVARRNFRSLVKVVEIPRHHYLPLLPRNMLYSSTTRSRQNSP